jgi:1-phosphatidylinositol-3-phosphate 5-kinase
MRASRTLNADIRSGDNIDLRALVKIKRLPGGTVDQSEYVRGLACSKNVAHKRMMRALIRPRILILTFPLEFYRVESQLMSLEPILAQEREYLRNLCNRILALHPSVVVSEKTVSRVALESLTEAGVVVVQHCKPSIIEFISRCTGAEIISTLDKITLRSDAQLGTCESMFVKTFRNALIESADGQKSLLFLDGCLDDRGCTFLLRGGTLELLGRVKKVADFMFLFRTA